MQVADREFRYLVNQDVGYLDVMQFVGVIPPSRAAMHSHSYDEIVYVIDGEGTLHFGGRETPNRAWVSHAFAAARRALSGKHRKGVNASSRGVPPLRRSRLEGNRVRMIKFCGRKKEEG